VGETLRNMLGTPRLLALGEAVLSIVLILIATAVAIRPLTAVVRRALAPRGEAHDADPQVQRRALEHPQRREEAHPRHRDKVPHDLHAIHTYPMKVLVTGGAGFIGSHVVDAYVEEGYDVVVVDNLTTGRREFLNPRARFFEMDIRDSDLRGVFERERPDVVNHHAAQASVTASVDDPAHDADVNIMGTLNLLELAKAFGTRKIVFASTGGAIYGDPERIPADESHPTRPLAPYGISKMAGEFYVRFFGGLGMSWAILRYANVYGPRQDPHGEAGVVAIFTNAMLAGNRPKIFGDGTQTRDFVYVEDVARANVLATESEEPGLANIATGVETTVNDVYRHLAESTQFRDPPVYAPARTGEVYRIALDPRQADDWLGWTADVALADGLRRTVDWFRR